MIASPDTPADTAAAEYAELIPLRDAATMLPRRRCGKKTHVATLYRWTDRGIRGTRLRYVQCGSVRCTTSAWLDDFFAKLTAAAGAVRTEAGTTAPPLASRTTAARRRAIDAAERKLDTLGV
jgi:hypothetical protein